MVFCFSTASSAASNDDYELALKSFYDQKYAATIIHLKNALRANESHIPSHLLLAKTLLAQGNGVVAETELADLQSMGVDFNQLVTLFGEAYILQDKYQQVVDVVTSGYRGNDIESQIQFIRGQAYIGLNQIRYAEQAFTEALQLQKDYPMAKLGLAQVMMIQNQLERAMRYVDEALDSYLPLPNAWIMKSVLLQMQGKLPAALTAINKALELSPNHLQAKLNRASLYLSENNYQQALPDIDFILEKIPAEPRAKYLKAVINAALGDDKGSKEKLNEVINTLNAVPAEVMSNNPSYYYLAGLTNFQFGNLDDARRYLRKFLKLKENDLSTLRLLALIDMQQGDFFDAKNILTKANIYFPDDANILTLLGNVALELNNIVAASRYFERVVALVPNYSPALENLARSDMAAGNYKAAIKHLLSKSTVLADPQDLSMTLLLVKSYIKSQQFKKAVPLTTRLIKAQSDNSFFHQQHGIALGFSGNITAARKEFLTALKLDPNNIEVIIHLARMSVIEKKYPAALTRLQQALIQFPNNIALTIEMADVYKISDDLTQSQQWYEKAFAYNEKNYFALTKLVNSYIENKQTKKAENILIEYLTQQKEDSQARVMLGQLYLLMNKPHEAIDTFKTASDNAKDRSQVLMFLASAQLKIDDRASAIKSLNKAIALDDQRLDPLMMLFPITLQQKDQARAEQLIYSITKLTPKQALGDLLSAKLAMRMQHYAKAEKYYKKAASINNNQETVLGLFQAQSKQGKHLQAGKIIRQWLTTHPNDVIADISLAENYANLGNNIKVGKIYRHLVKKYQGMPIILNNAANLLYQLGGKQNKQQALNYAEQAYKKVPKNVDIIDTLAWIEARNGDIEKALPLFRDALVIDFSNPEVKYHLAMILFKQNRKNEAQKLMIEAVKSERDFAEKAAAKQLLKKWVRH